MRALRKIVFVNSAHIRYAEVMLDGNVHFIGTQGVGKSTLLRAILFFYNADKLHLGIPKEMKTFDEFYLPHANSYIVYEVEHEHGPFCILVFRSSGRACFRFIDDGFNKRWLVDAHGEVTAEGKVIRERVGGAYMSRIIDRYEHYRDIIYGNRQAAGKEFARFQLMESGRYQNIPRSIQNVFLNSRLDADFIKDIIIRSMNEEEANIDLGYFRRQVADFEQEYRDISCWYKFNARGEAAVRKQADAVVNAYHGLLFMEQQVAELCGELKQAVSSSGGRLPLIAKRIEEIAEERNRLVRLLDKLQHDYDLEKSALNQEQGVVLDKLKRLKERRAYYADVHIGEVMGRWRKEPVLRSELETLGTRLADLTTRYDDVTAKYEALRHGLENRIERYRQEQGKRLLELGKERQMAEARLLEEYKKRLTEVEAAFEGKLSIAANTIEQLKDEQADTEKELLKLRYWKPYQTEQEAIGKELDTLSSRQKELQALMAASEAAIRQCQSEYEREEAAVTNEGQQRLELKRGEVEATEARIAETDRLLERTSGSLYEWLEENARGWEDNIGRVISEEQVLYHTGLHPQRAEGRSLFGVRLDLSQLPMAVRKPSQLKEERATLKAALRTLKADLAALAMQQEKDLEQLRARFSPRMKELRRQMSALETERAMVPQRQKALKAKLQDWTGKAAQATETRRQQLAARQQDIALRRTDADAALERLKADKSKQRRTADKAYRMGREEYGRRHDEAADAIRADIGLQEKRIEAEVLELGRKEMAELEGRGADTRMVEECKASIRQAEEELKFIEEHRRLVFNYQRDKEELFDQEEPLKSQKKLLAEKLLQLGEKYALRRRRHDEALAACHKELAERREEQARIEAGLQKADRFVHDANLCPPAWDEAAPRQTLRTPGQAVDELTGIILSRQKRMEQLKQGVNIFKANFSAKNTFNFRTELTLDDDYLDFANNLDDFLINNKIEEYRRRTSERYVDILARISKEMGELTRHESDVDRIIHDINNDFRERNFAGVIKLIALQSVPSADKMVQLMKRIKDFNDENQFAMGELNLFSSANRDELNQQAVGHLLDFMKMLLNNPQRQQLTLSDLFRLQFRIVENDNDTGWADKLSHVGSEGTDTLVKAMINIMLINVFKEKVSKRFGDFRIHCMMDEIGKLHPQNVKGILDFANARNILLINSSPTTYNVSDYRYTYLLSKDSRSQTVVHPLIAQQ